MTSKNLIIGIILFIIVLLGIQQYIIWNTPNAEDILFNRITELERKIDNLSNKKDSIKKVIDSTHIKIIDNEKHYQEKVSTIIIQPDSFSESFTKQYLRDYASTRGYSIIGTSETE